MHATYCTRLPRDERDAMRSWRERIEGQIRACEGESCKSSRTCPKPDCSGRMPNKPKYVELPRRVAAREHVLRLSLPHPTRNPPLRTLDRSSSLRQPLTARYGHQMQLASLRVSPSTRLGSSVNLNSVPSSCGRLQLGLVGLPQEKTRLSSRHSSDFSLLTGPAWKPSLTCITLRRGSSSTALLALPGAFKT